MFEYYVPRVKIDEIPVMVLLSLYKQNKSRMNIKMFKAIYPIKISIWNWACMCMLNRFSHVWLFTTPYTLAHQSLSMGFSRQENWKGALCSVELFEAYIVDCSLLETLLLELSKYFFHLVFKNPPTFKYLISLKVYSYFSLLLSFSQCFLKGYHP